MRLTGDTWPDPRLTDPPLAARLPWIVGCCARSCSPSRDAAAVSGRRASCGLQTAGSFLRGPACPRASGGADRTLAHPEIADLNCPGPAEERARHVGHALSTTGRLQNIGPTHRVGWSPRNTAPTLPAPLDCRGAHLGPPAAACRRRTPNAPAGPLQATVQSVDS